MLANIKIYLVAILFIYIFTGCSKNNSVAQTGENIVLVSVNDENIYSHQVDKMVDGVVNAYSQYYRQMGHELNDDDLMQMKQTYRQQIIEQMIVEKLLLQEAMKNDIIISDDEFESEFALFKAEMSSSPDEYSNMLMMMGFDDEAGFKEKFKTNMKIMKYLENNFDFDSVSDAELKDFYDANIELFSTSENREIEHILLMIDDEDDKETKYNKIVDIKNQITEEGKDFNVLAEQHSDCPSKNRQGKLGNLEKGMLDPVFESTAFSLQKNEISDIVLTQFGYHIIRVTDIQDGKTHSFDDVKHHIKEELTAEERNMKIQSLIEQLKDEADIEFYN